MCTDGINWKELYQDLWSETLQNHDDFAKLEYELRVLTKKFQILRAHFDEMLAQGADDYIMRIL